ncbi:unnamed protein product [Thelazia callipaeda]|uniref:Alpha-1,3-glucosyltransferase n=1 Tax=Thelazia callipaeda TaxID=103827 RepID=A0A0N5CJI3_THECL|nr:unnamed protein product [Thelazia callipaeda]
MECGCSDNNDISSCCDDRKAVVSCNVSIDNPTSRMLILAVICLIVTIQLALSCGSYSGYATPPMYGDYEAQRHWMEITYHLPISQYVNSSDNDLNYWGLDYPPLTAYHSWLLGTLANKFNSSWVELHMSRGIEAEFHKFFMRMSVLVTYWIVYAPSLLLSIGFFHNLRSLKMLSYCTIALLYPGLLSMDNGHFQYNHMSLGLFLFSFACFVSNFLRLGSVFFILAINFKQMELYHALPIAMYLLSRCFLNNIGFSTFERYFSLASSLLMLFITAIMTMILVWLPFLITHSDLFQILHRIFPFYRGLFEDKVANFWFAVNVFFKIKENFELSSLLRLSAVAVMITNIPCLLCIFYHPSVVHEKSILFVAIPAILLWKENSVFISWLLIISNASLYPLCIVDGNATHLSLFVLYYLIASSSFAQLSLSKRLVVHGSCLGSLILCLASLLFSPPKRYPHIFSLLVAVYCFCHFMLFFLYVNIITVKPIFKKKDE